MAYFERIDALVAADVRRAELEKDHCMLFLRQDFSSWYGIRRYRKIFKAHEEPFYAAVGSSCFTALATRLRNGELIAVWLNPDEKEATGLIDVHDFVVDHLEQEFPDLGVNKTVEEKNQPTYVSNICFDLCSAVALISASRSIYAKAIQYDETDTAPMPTVEQITEPFVPLSQ